MPMAILLAALLQSAPAVAPPKPSDALPAVCWLYVVLEERPTVSVWPLAGLSVSELPSTLSTVPWMDAPKLRPPPSPANPPLGSAPFANGALPSGGFAGLGGGRNFGASIQGTVESVDGSSLTLKPASGQTLTVGLSSSTTYNQQTAGSASDGFGGATAGADWSSAARRMAMGMAPKLPRRANRSNRLAHGRASP